MGFSVFLVPMILRGNRAEYHLFRLDERRNNQGITPTLCLMIGLFVCNMKVTSVGFD